MHNYAMRFSTECLRGNPLSAMWNDSGREEVVRVWESSRGLHRDALDEDVSVAGLLGGVRDLPSDRSVAA
jgi:hypothetical protein